MNFFTNIYIRMCITILSYCKIIDRIKNKMFQDNFLKQNFDEYGRFVFVCLYLVGLRYLFN